jgi:hypothetical protein
VSAIVEICLDKKVYYKTIEYLKKNRPNLNCHDD